MDETFQVQGFTVCKLVGRGTQGSVYKAYTKTSPKTAVAIKVIDKSNLSRKGRDNLVSEIGILKKLKHKFIVDLVDFHWDDKYIYIVMEYCGGGDLSSVIKQRKCLPESSCQRFLQQLASAMLFLRQHNISHMDLKPSNLLVKGTNPPILKLADFGFAQHLEEDSKDKGLKGSPLYMAPEIFLSDQYDAKADLWSIGVILYEALFGRAPFSCESLEKLVVKIKEDVPVVIPPSNKLSSNCRDLLSRCLVRCPEKRIDFPDFFSHPFLDLEHLPDENSFQKASELVTRAVAADKAKKAEEAVELYEESLKYFLPLLHYETDLKRREKLRATVSGYKKRKEELRSRDCPSSSTDSHASLRALCRTSSSLQTGVDICISGEDYLRGGEMNLGLEKITTGLGLLVPALQQEPRGARRDILRREVTGWMEKAEKVKDVLASQSVSEECCDQSEEKLSCRLQ